MSVYDTAVRMGFTVGAVMLLAVVVLPFTRTVQSVGHIAKCRSNLWNIGRLAQTYADTHQGCFPTNFNSMRDLSGFKAELFRCPGAGVRSLPNTPVDAWTAYGLVRGRTTNDPADTVLAVCSPKHHRGPGRGGYGLLLYVDGRVLEQSRDNYDRIVLRGRGGGGVLPRPSVGPEGANSLVEDLDVADRVDASDSTEQ